MSVSAAIGFGFGYRTSEVRCGGVRYYSAPASLSPPPLGDYISFSVQISTN